MPWYNLVWVLLAGFLLGWISSTLFEWLWYRGRRNTTPSPPPGEGTASPAPIAETAPPPVAPSPAPPETPAPTGQVPPPTEATTPPPAAASRPSPPTTPTSPVEPTRVPDDLTRIRGIGKVYAKRLYQAGIATFHQLAQADPDTLRAVTGAGPTANIEAWQRQAEELARQEGRVGVVYTGPPPDDLTELEGLSPTIRQQLYRHGIVTFEQLARMSPEQLAEILPMVNDRNLLARWIAEAGRRAALSPST